MGLFDKRDKKRKDDFDSPVEQIDLSAAPAPQARASEPVRQPDPAPPATVPAHTPAPKPASAAAAAAPPATDDYGIDKAIELMRTLPQDNVELVVQVVKFSLQSVGIKLPVIIEDAIRRQQDIQGRIGVLKGEIAELESEIKQRRGEIDRLEADHKETTLVRERLELAEKLGKPDAKAGARAAPRQTTPPAPSAPLASVTGSTPAKK